jgi:flagellar L-ring protein precursor FlgH
MDKRGAIVLFTAVFLLAGCGMSRIPTPPPVESTLPNAKGFMELPKPEEGSLWTETVEASLYTELRARRVGDIVTVRIVEDPEAELNANTKTSRSSSIGARMEFLGYMEALAAKNPRLNPDDLINASLQSQHDGKGSSNRDGHVKAYVSAVVERVFPNGNLYIKGRREIRVNHEKQYIMLSGMIRPEDINADNEIASTFVADAEIVYAGVGPVSDKQKPGWLGRVIDHVWPF